MISITNKIKLKRNVKVSKKDGKTVVSNETDKKGFIVFAKIIYCKKKMYKLTSSISTLDGDGCQVKLLNRKLRVVENIDPNSVNYFDDINKITFVGITVFPHTTIKINEINIEYEYDKEQDISKNFNGDILLLCPGYPTYDNKYRCAFIHSRMQAYKKENLKVDLAVVNENCINKSSISKFENIKVVSTGYNDIRKILQNKKYKKILIHFFDERYAQILDASDLTETEIIIYSHGSDTLYRAWDRLNAKYFENITEIPEKVYKIFPEKDDLIKRYNEKGNVKFVFVSNWAKNLSEKLIGIKYNNAYVIPCNIDTDIFKYNEKKSDLRKKIFVIRKYDNLSTYSIDIAVKVVLELSTRKIFDDLEFSFYGDGDYHDVLLAPLKNFPNVHIYKKFLSHKEIAQVHKENGIGLFPTRFDTQAVSSCEAAMSGNVVITSNGVGTEEYIYPNIGTYCDTENIKQYADLIEKIYFDEKLFKELSKQTHDCVAKTCSYNNTIGADLKLIKSKSNIAPFKYKKQVNNPILTIAVPSYNVAKFLKAGIHSLIDNKYSNKLEILIINDGSKDDTAKIGKELEKLTTNGDKSIVKLIDKPNGGHGSTINKGIELATGKYFKLMDGDDYFIEKDFLKFIEILEKEDSDIILTNYVADYAIDAVKTPVRNYSFMVPGVQYHLDNMKHFGYGFEQWGPLLSTSTYKTKILKDANFKIDEHCFYVDMEYNFIGYLNSKTVIYYPLDIYNYYLGRAGQSVSAESYRRNFKNHEKVTLRLIEEYYKIPKDVSENKKYYLKNKIIIPLVEAQYYILTQNLKSPKEFRKFNKKLKKYPEIYKDDRVSRKAIKLHRALNAFGMNFIETILNVKNRFKGE